MAAQCGIDSTLKGSPFSPSRSVRRRGTPAALPAALLLLALAAPGRYARADTSRPVSLGWTRAEGAEKCIDQRTLQRRVRARLGRDPFSGEAETAIEGSVSRRAETFRAELFVRGPNGEELGRRELSAAGADCAPLGDAVVLAVALVIDPTASVLEPEVDSTTPEVASGTVSPNAPCPVTPAFPSAGNPMPPPLVAPAPLCAAPHQDDPGRRASQGDRTAQIGVDGRLLAAFGVLPQPALGAALTTHILLGDVAFEARASFFPAVPSRDPRILFGLTTFGAAGCYEPLTLPDGALGWCAGLEGGAMHVAVRELTPIRPGDDRWFGATTGPRLEWSPAWAAPLHLGAEARAVTPILRRAYGVRGGEDVFTEPVVGLAVGVGMGATLP